MRILTFAVTLGVLTTCWAIHPKVIIEAKTKVGGIVADKITSAVQAKQDLILKGTKAVLSAKQELFNRQLPHLVNFKKEKLQTVLEFKKGILSSAANHLGHLYWANDNKEHLEADKAPVAPLPAVEYGPPAEEHLAAPVPVIPQVPVHEIHTTYVPQPTVVYGLPPPLLAPGPKPTGGSYATPSGVYSAGTYGAPLI